jgi:hypothetical protein
MGRRDAFPAEMPNHPIPALDDDTVERLLAARLDPDDAPPAYAGVARLLRAAAAPPCPDALAGEPAALAAFRSANPAATSGRPGRVARFRGRLVAVALAGVLVASGAAAGWLWTTEPTPSAVGLRSPTGGPGTGGAGSSLPRSGGSGLLRPAGSPPVTERDRAVARHGGGMTSRGGGPALGVRSGRPGTVEAPGLKPPKAKKPKPKGAKADPDKGGNRQGGNRK